MSDAVFQRNPAVSRTGKSRRSARWAPGYGLTIAAAASIGLWGGIFWITARLLG